MTLKKIVQLLPVLLLAACGPEKKQAEAKLDESKLQKRIEEVQKPALAMENDEINAYIKSHGLNMQVTGAGLRYQVLKENKKGTPIVSKDIVKVDFKVSLLNGKLCYTSDSLGPREFIVDHDHIENGIHQGIKLLRSGEKALFILPSHLAHGLMGDENKIPPKAAVVYEIEVLSVKQN